MKKLLLSILIPVFSTQLVLAEDLTACNQVQALVKKAAELRKLAVLKPIKCQEFDSKDYIALANSKTRKANDLKELRYGELIYKALGLIPSSYRYSHCMLEASGDASLAMYDRDSKRIIVRRDLVTPDWVLIHEIVHALQDQHFDLSKIRKNISTSDQELAISALIEGDAMVIEELAKNGMNSKSNLEVGTPLSGYSVDCEPPEALFNVLMFVYEWGSRYVGMIGLEKQTDQAFIRPPTTSWEILYPKKYLNNESPHKLMDLELVRLKHSGQKILFSDVLGEYVLRALLKEYMDQPTALLAAKGWSGDRVQVYRESKGNYLKIYWQLHFEQASDIEQVLSAFKKYTERRFGVTIDSNAQKWSVTPSPDFVFSFSSSGLDLLVDVSTTITDSGFQNSLKK